MAGNVGNGRKNQCHQKPTARKAHWFETNIVLSASLLQNLQTQPKNLSNSHSVTNNDSAIALQPTFDPILNNNNKTLPFPPPSFRLREGDDDDGIGAAEEWAWTVHGERPEREEAGMVEAESSSRWKVPAD